MRRIEERGEVTFCQAIKDYIQGWVSYGGRSTRAGYWWAQLAVVLYFIIGLLLSLVLVTTVHVLGIIVLCIPSFFSLSIKLLKFFIKSFCSNFSIIVSKPKFKLFLLIYSNNLASPVL